MLQSFYSFFQAKRFFSKPLSFLILVVCLLSIILALTACHSKESKEKNVTTQMEKSQTQPLEQNFQVISQPTTSASVATVETKTLSENTLKIAEVDEIANMVEEDDVLIDPQKVVDNHHFNTLLSHYAVNQFLPDGEESQDFQQAYLASIYTMRHNLPDIKPDDSPDVVFIKNMIQHRQGLMNFATLQLKYGQDASLQYFAKDIIASQENEIWLMEHWLKEVYPTLTKPDKQPIHFSQNLEQEYQNSLNQMYEQMLVGALQDDADMVFIQTTLPLLKGALAMAQVELKYGLDNKVRGIADNIIMNQIPEIQALQKWQKEHR